MPKLIDNLHYLLPPDFPPLHRRHAGGIPQQLQARIIGRRRDRGRADEHEDRGLTRRHSHRREACADRRENDLVRPVDDLVWDLYEHVIGKLGPLPTLIEWDNDVPDWPVLKREAQRADAILDRHASTDRGLRHAS